jgi:pimeloyl-ACP methyl ester carboxylesterase
MIADGWERSLTRPSGIAVPPVSFNPYAQTNRPQKPITAPTAFSIFPKDLVNAPREFAERFFDVRSWVEETSGGHFAAWERPERYTAGVRAAMSLA